MKRWIYASLSVTLLAVTVASGQSLPLSLNFHPSPQLPDVSGLAWIEGDRFITIHDAKGSADQPRASLVTLPTGDRRFQWQSLPILWPHASDPGRDLESVARIPATLDFLVAESGSAGDRLFLTRYDGQHLKVIETIPWPAPIQNVEGMTVAQIGTQLVFLYAERAGGQAVTHIRWAPLRLNPIQFGPFQSVPWTSPLPAQKSLRLVSEVAVDQQGALYVTSATDPDLNHGPFRSWVWHIGNLEPQRAGSVQVVLDPVPQLLARLDGFKVEGLVVRDGADRQPEMIVGSDDENYGGIVRSLPPLQKTESQPQPLGVDSLRLEPSPRQPPQEPSVPLK
jgi:hypothetical protein